MSVRVDMKAIQDACDWVCAGEDAGLVFRFVDEQMPQSIEQVERIFRKSGAYKRFKGLLDAADRLDQWHAYEQTATEQGLAQWCVENGFVPSPPAAD